MSTPAEPAPLHEVPQPAGWRVPLLVAALVGVGVMAGIIWLGPPGSEPRTPPVSERLPPLSAEAEAYLPQVELAGFEMSRWANFLGQEVTYLDLTLTNRGPRTVVALELTIEFHDALDRVVLRENVRAIGTRRAAPLISGQSREVRAAFEDIPAAWNRLPPRVRISGLLLQ